MARIDAFTKNNLNKQGFGKLDDESKSHYALPLRFTPAVATILIAIGLAFQSSIWIGAMALVALSGALLPNAMLFDLVYNLGVRHLFHAPLLPPTPKPRQFSYLLSTIFLAGSALAFYGLMSKNQPVPPRTKTPKCSGEDCASYKNQSSQDKP